MSREIIRAGTIAVGDTILLGRLKSEWHVSAVSPVGKKSIGVVAHMDGGRPNQLTFRRSTVLEVRRRENFSP